MAKTTWKTRTSRFLRTRKGKILLAVVLVLVVLRLLLPTMLLHYANRQLAGMKGYYGHIDDVDVFLLRGAYTLDSLYINKVEQGGKQTEFFSSKVVDLSIEWTALLSGRLVGELDFQEPHIRFSKNRVEPTDVRRDTSSFQLLLHRLMPIEVNRAQIRSGTVTYLDNTARPNVELALTDVNAVATNLRNVYRKNEVLPANLDATASLHGGRLRLDMNMNPLAPRATFDLNAAAEGADLVQLNDFFKAYAGVDVSKGTFSMYTEAAAKNGRFTGYVKPVIKDLDVVEFKGQDKNDSFFQKLWESVAEGVGTVLENPREKQVATKIQFSGDIRDPESNFLETVGYVLQNAFVQALKPSIENRINLDKVGAEEQKKGFFEKLFNQDDDEKGKKRKKNT